MQESTTKTLRRRIIVPAVCAVACLIVGLGVASIVDRVQEDIERAA